MSDIQYLQKYRQKYFSIGGSPLIDEQYIQNPYTLGKLYKSVYVKEGGAGKKKSKVTSKAKADNKNKAVNKGKTVNKGNVNGPNKSTPQPPNKPSSRGRTPTKADNIRVGDKQARGKNSQMGNQITNKELGITVSGSPTIPSPSPNWKALNKSKLQDTWEKIWSNLDGKTKKSKGEELIMLSKFLETMSKQVQSDLDNAKKCWTALNKFSKDNGTCYPIYAQKQMNKPDGWPGIPVKVWSDLPDGSQLN